MQGINNIPADLLKYTEKWKKFHPTWTYEFWDEQRILNFITEFYSEYLSTWNSFTNIVNKSDFARMLIIHKYGGIYVDIDSYPVKKLELLLSNTDIDSSCNINISKNITYNSRLFSTYNLILPISNLVINNYNSKKCIDLNNSFIASIENNPVFIDIINFCKNRTNLRNSIMEPYSIYGITEYFSENNITDTLFLPPSYINDRLKLNNHLQFVVHEYRKYWE